MRRVSVFKENFSTPNNPCAIIFKVCKEWVSVGRIDKCDVMKESHLINWIPPLEGWIKINVDGNKLAQRDVIAINEVLRNDKKEWLIGFAANKGCGTVFEAQL
ncbi:hypothetical protein ACOSP7_018436 [Xanthoceras sorbifolium]